MPKINTDSLSSLGEFGLINRIRKTACKKSSSVIKGIGDDAAVVSVGKDKVLLLTADMLIAGVHFTKDMGAERIGRKSVACSISDIAAMGGLPKHAVVSLGVSSKEDIKFVDGIYKGMRAMCNKFDVAIVGGDTVKSDKLIINVALTGEAKRNEVVYRSGAKKKDKIFVTGSLGRSLKSGKHLDFSPRINESQYLIKNFRPTSMIDISDGLALDLGHIMEESNVGAVLNEANIPLSNAANVESALYDGEDFELLFTLSSKDANKLLMRNKNKPTFRFIGEIVDKKQGLKMEFKDGSIKKIEIKGYTHF